MKRLSLLIPALLAPALATADARIHMSSDIDGDVDSVLSVRDGHMLMEADGRGDTTVLFTADSGNLTVINHSRKSYMTMDDKTMDQMQGQIDAAMKQMQEQLKNMPEEQRKMIMERMPQMKAMEEKPKSTYSVKKTGDKDTVADVACHTMEVMKNGMPEGVGCIATAKAMGIANKDFDTMVAMFNRLKSMAGRFSDDDTPDLQALGGFPMRMTDANGRVTTQVTRIETGELDKGMFQVPADYTPESMPGM
ncbi:MAG: DUF4412 domain-containing protein [Pseudomonadota bacterium]